MEIRKQHSTSPFLLSPHSGIRSSTRVRSLGVITARFLSLILTLSLPPFLSFGNEANSKVLAYREHLSDRYACGYRCRFLKSLGRYGVGIEDNESSARDGTRKRTWRVVAHQETRSSTTSAAVPRVSRRRPTARNTTGSPSKNTGPITPS